MFQTTGKDYLCTLALCDIVEGVQILLTLPSGVSSVVLVRITMENGRPGGNGPVEGAFIYLLARHSK